MSDPLGTLRPRAASRGSMASPGPMSFPPEEAVAVPRDAGVSVVPAGPCSRSDRRHDRGCRARCPRGPAPRPDPPDSQDREGSGAAHPRAAPGCAISSADQSVRSGSAAWNHQLPGALRSARSRHTARDRHAQRAPGRQAGGPTVHKTLDDEPAPGRGV
jgi:hypothetical protein